MVGAAEEADPDLIIVSATYRGKQIAARVAGRLDTGLCSGCTAVRVNAGQFELDRLAYGGTAVQTVACTRRPAMVTIAPGLFESARITKRKPGEVKELPAPLPSVVKVLERRPKLREVKTITEAKAIVCAGRGIGKRMTLPWCRNSPTYRRRDCLYASSFRGTAFASGGALRRPFRCFRKTGSLPGYRSLRTDSACHRNQEFQGDSGGKQGREGADLRGGGPGNSWGPI